MIKKIISWDLGATKCAAALVEYDSTAKTLNCKKKHSLKLTSCHSLDELISQLENGLGISIADTDAICIGAAGHFDGRTVKLESGYPYSMRFADMAEKYHWPRMAVIHDYAPIVCSTFTSYMHDAANVKRLNDCPMQPFGRRVALGVGTGLGLKDGVLFEDGNFWLGQNEMGHIGITAPPLLEKRYQERHRELIRFLVSENVLKPNEPLTFERILTGSGTVKLYQFCNPSAAPITPEELGCKLRNGEANEVLELFAWYLGLFVGTVQLSFMPEGGIWITGGVVLNHLNVFEYPEFYHGVEASPGYLALRKHIPLGVLCNHEHAFMGGAYYATKILL